MPDDSQVKLDPFDRALLEILCELSGNWTAIDLDGLTHTQEKALNRLTKAGLVEQRLAVTGEMDGFPAVVHLRCRVSGNYTQLLFARTLEVVPEWLTPEGKTKAKYRIDSDLLAARLTVDGERAKQDFESPEPSVVLALVRGMGPHDTGILPDGSVFVESCGVENREPKPLDTSGAPGQVSASPQASIGDITVDNRVNVAQPQVVVNIDKALLSKFKGKPTVETDPRVLDDPLWLALDQTIIRLREDPHTILYCKRPDSEGGLNTDTINRLAKEAGLCSERPVFRVREEEAERFVEVMHPLRSDAVSWRRWAKSMTGGDYQRPNSTGRWRTWKLGI